MAKESISLVVAAGTRRERLYASSVARKEFPARFYRTEISQQVKVKPHWHLTIELMPKVFEPCQEFTQDKTLTLSNWHEFSRILPSLAEYIDGT